jgi:hypothetical protein
MAGSSPAMTRISVGFYPLAPQGFDLLAPQGFDLLAPQGWLIEQRVDIVLRDVTLIGVEFRPVEQR